MLLGLLACVGGSDVKVGVYNTPPSASIVFPTEGTAFDEGEIIDFEAIIADSQDAPDTLEILWTSDIQGQLVGGDLPLADGTLYYSTANLSVGIHVITLMVTDTSQESTQTTTSVEIIDLPEQPEIEILHPTAAESGIENEPFDFEATVWDARDELNQISVTLSSDQQGDICSLYADENGRALCSGILSPGQHLLVFTAVNTIGYSSAASTYFNVVALIDIDNDGDGFTENQGDCDDEDPSTVPGAIEQPNGIDDNCNGTIDEGTSAYDDDGDGFSEDQGDCDDGNITVNPNATEDCSDGIDNNCNNTQNEENALNCTTFYRDADADGYGDVNFSECWCSAGGSTGEYSETNSNDCFDGNPDANPTQSGYFSIHRGDGSFDYNCNSSEEKYLTSIGSCSGWQASFNDACPLNTVGWNEGQGWSASHLPDCGETKEWLSDTNDCTSCGFLGTSCCTTIDNTQPTETQICR